jgi:hypothetical protein
MKIIFGRSAVTREIGVAAGVKQSQTPSASFSFIKDFRLTWGMIMLLLLVAYTYWPLEPRMPANTELQEVVGMSRYESSNSSTNSGYVFTVGGVKLNCELGALGGGTGCGYISQAILNEKPVRAAYFWMPTRLGYDYKLLHTLEQEGRQILSPEQSYAHAMNSYRIRWDIYRVLIWLFVTLAVFSWLIEGLGTIYIVKKSGE